jgi:CHAT domain-containing protein
MPPPPPIQPRGSRKEVQERTSRPLAENKENLKELHQTDLEIIQIYAKFLRQVKKKFKTFKHRLTSNTPSTLARLLLGK